MTTQTETNVDFNPGVIQIKDAIIELDRLLEVYKSVDIQVLLKEYFQSENSQSMLKDLIVDKMTDYNFLSCLAPQLASQMFHYLEEHGNEEDNYALNTFYSRITRGIVDTNYKVRSTILEEVERMVREYVNSIFIQSMIKDQVAQAVTNIEFKTQVSIKN